MRDDADAGATEREHRDSVAIVHASSAELEAIARDERLRLGAMLESFEVAPRGLSVTCAASECRAVLTFESDAALRSLTRVPFEPDRMRIALSGTQVYVSWRPDDAPF